MRSEFHQMSCLLSCFVSWIDYIDSMISHKLMITFAS